jgi:hypothetical protein
VTTLTPEVRKALVGEADRILERRSCAEHPAHLLDRVVAVDAKTGERFPFQLVKTSDPWYWQRTQLLDWWLDVDLSMCLKGRQIGVTWVAGGFGLWTALYRPGTRVLIISINEDEATKVVGRIWDMFESLPAHLRNDVKVIKPSRGIRPHREIEFLHADGSVSAIVGLPSTKKAGHGETAALVILDEFARQEYAQETWKAVLPTVAGGGKVLVISTANGVSSSDGEGNFYHHLWTHADEYGIGKKFLRWDLHPGRDETWYRRFAMALPPRDRAEQYPDNPHEAFILSGEPYFDLEALADYARRGTKAPAYRCRFTERFPGRARIEQGQTGWIRVFSEPDESHSYAIGCDVATGRGTDYSSATVVDLTSMEFVAELHGKIDADLYAQQLHYLGRYYGTARIAVETGGGYGEAPIAFLRDGKDGRPAYPKLYRHRHTARADFAEFKPFGFPMTQKTRPIVLQGLERALRERSLPFVSAELLSELQTFVHRSTGTSPRAQDGCNDDRVMAAAIAVELYRQYGTHERAVHRRSRYKPKRPYPWLKEYA